MEMMGSGQILHMLGGDMSSVLQAADSISECAVKTAARILKRERELEGESLTSGRWSFKPILNIQSEKASFVSTTERNSGTVKEVSRFWPRVDWTRHSIESGKVTNRQREEHGELRFLLAKVPTTSTG